MRQVVVRIAALNAVLLYGCSTTDREPAVQPKSAIESIYTDLVGGSCRKEIDRTDPNETPYLACPGVAGYSLIVRDLDSGRQSLDLVDASHQVRPLNYQEFVTRHMSNLSGRAEWRVATRDGQQVPIALLVQVQAREGDDPEQVTRTYIAVAKITPAEACVTSRLALGTQSDAEVRRAADSAETSPCATALPARTAAGSPVR